jgi:hypothetical protein
MATHLRRQTEIGSIGVGRKQEERYVVTYHSMPSFSSLQCGLEKEYVLVHTAHNYDAHPEEQI